MIIVLSGGYVAWSYTQLTGSITQIANAIPHSQKSAAAAATGAQNILLIGDDHRPAGATQAELQQLGTQQDGGSTNTDTMIVLHIAPDGQSATMISFPRDSWVTIPGFGKGKLNSAFADGESNGGGAAGGARLLIQTIENISGLSIDHYMRVSLLGFYQIVGTLGPVQVCLNHAVYDHYSGVNLPAGVSTLNASQALAFVRQRHGLPNGDLDREVRQQYFLSQEAKKILSAGTLLNPIKLTKVLDSIGSSIETDMSSSDLIGLGTSLRHLSVSNIRSATIPTSGTPTIYVGGVAVSTVALDTAAIPAFIESIVGPPAAYTNATAAAPSSVQVVAENGSGVPGAALKATSALQALGFKTGAAIDASENTSTTSVEYPAGMEAQAKAVVNVVPGAIPVLSTTVTQVTLLLGSDGHSVQSSAPAAPSTAPSSQAAAPAAPTSSAAAPAATPSASTKAYGQSGTCIN